MWVAKNVSQKIGEKTYMEVYTAALKSTTDALDFKAALKISTTCACVALRGLVSMQASFCAFSDMMPKSASFTPSSAKPDGIPIEAESWRIA